MAGLGRKIDYSNKTMTLFPYNIQYTNINHIYSRIPFRNNYKFMQFIMTYMTYKFDSFCV